ncbi:hypothetical protein [Sphingomonas sp.]|uniref:hypothetical protein n=1 Tax=Sphingomonas sp. TaxID=28214 RepID=UPI003BACA5C7
MSDKERTVGWIDYVIASDDPGDKALADEFLASNWSYSQTMQWIVQETATGGLAPEMMAQLERETAAGRAIQERILARGQALAASGARPADAATAEAWHARRRNLCPTVPSGNPISRA